MCEVLASNPVVCVSYIPVMEEKGKTKNNFINCSSCYGSLHKKNNHEAN
jgi:hypothetical protein